MLCNKEIARRNVLNIIRNSLIFLHSQTQKTHCAALEGQGRKYRSYLPNLIDDATGTIQAREGQRAHIVAPSPNIFHGKRRFSNWSIHRRRKRKKSTATSGWYIVRTWVIGFGGDRTVIFLKPRFDECYWKKNWK